MSRLSPQLRRAFVGFGLAALTSLPSLAGAQQDRPSGAEVWAANCGRCHRMRAPSTYTASQWDAIVTQMSLYARLTPDETQAVRQFLASGARRTGGSADASAPVASPEPRVRQIAYLGRVPFSEGLLLQATQTCGKPADGPNTAATLYRVQCAMCHGPTGKGDGRVARTQNLRPASLADSALMAKMSDDSLVAVVTAGRDDMPAFKDELTTDQIRAVVSYVRCFSTP